LVLLLPNQSHRGGIAILHTIGFIND
jgi:hypothetical protein